MELAQIKITLNPAEDGLFAMAGECKVNDRRGVVIGTNGAYRVVTGDEVNEIFDKLGTNSQSTSVGDYIGVYDARKQIYPGGGKYLVGSMLVIACDGPRVARAITEEEVAKMYNEFMSRMVSISIGAESFGAYEIAY